LCGQSGSALGYILAQLFGKQGATNDLSRHGYCSNEDGLKRDYKVPDVVEASSHVGRRPQFCCTAALKFHIVKLDIAI
jgi:hypothetical protein